MSEDQTKYQTAIVKVDEQAVADMAAEMGKMNIFRGPERLLAARIAVMYGLDPMMKHLVFVGGELTISAKGVLAIARNSSKIKAIKTRFATLEERAAFGLKAGEHAALCQVFTHGSDEPYEGWGFATDENCSGKVQNSFRQAMAETRAINRTVLRVDGPTLLSLEELDPADRATGEIDFSGAKKRMVAEYGHRYNTQAGAHANIALQTAGMARIGGWDGLTSFEQLDALQAYLDGPVVEAQTVTAVEAEALPALAAPEEVPTADDDLIAAKLEIQQRYCLKQMGGKTTMAGLSKTAVANVMSEALHRANVDLTIGGKPKAKSFDTMTAEQIAALLPSVLPSVLPQAVAA